MNWKNTAKDMVIKNDLEQALSLLKTNGVDVSEWEQRLNTVKQLREIKNPQWLDEEDNLAAEILAQLRYDSLIFLSA